MSSYKALINQTGETWNKLNKDERESLISYTGSKYTGVNSDLKNGYYENSGYKKEIDNITSALEKSSYNIGVTMRRAVINESSVFGFSVSKATPEELNSIVGKTYKMKQFGSFSASKGSDFGGNASIILTAPKGTKMMYVEPFSKFGQNQKDWDGKPLYTKNGKRYKIGENEIILQRGTSYRVDKVERKRHHNIIYATVVKQDKH